MSKKQIKKDLEELYVGQNIGELQKKYYSKKKKEMFLLCLSGLLLILLVLYKEYDESKLSEENMLFRNENGEGKKEVALEVRTIEGEWQEFILELQEREYEEHELEEMYSQAIKQVPQEILAENSSLTHVSKDLNMVQEIKGFPFMLTWESSDSEVIDSLGRISTKGLNAQGTTVELKAIFSYQQWRKEHIIAIRIYPDNENSFLVELKDKIQELENSSRKQIEFYLPDTFRKNTLQWRYAKGNTAIMLGIILFVLLPVIDYQKDQEIHKQLKRRKDKLQKQYPEFITRLILYMEAGMNIKGAIYKITEEYQKKKNQGEKNFGLYEELLYVCRQNRNGLSEEETYLLLGQRCNLPCYKKLTGLLIQHLQKGSYGILEMLRTEVRNANEERKKQIKKQGEEMGTKLLLPMMLMLMVVMVLIMVPACFSFQM